MSDSTNTYRTDGSSEPVLVADEISHSFGELTVLKEISIEIPFDSVTAVVGPNGSGKTTLLRILTGLLTPSRGAVHVLADHNRPVGYLPQEPGFRPTLSVEETIEFYAGLLSQEVETEDLLTAVGLSEVRSRRVEALSGGMVRLLGLAVAMLGSPSLIVLDEPTSSLDPRMTDEIIETIVSLTDGETSILLTTHDLASLDGIDRVIIIDRGRIVRQGPLDLLTEATDRDSLREAFLSLIEGGPAVQPGQEGGL